VEETISLSFGGGTSCGVASSGIAGVHVETMKLLPVINPLADRHTAQGEEAALTGTKR